MTCNSFRTPLEITDQALAAFKITRLHFSPDKFQLGISCVSTSVFLEELENRDEAREAGIYAG